MVSYLFYTIGDLTYQSPLVLRYARNFVTSGDWQDQIERYQHRLDWQSDLRKRCSLCPRHEGMYGNWRHSSTSSQKEICRSAECVSSVSGR